MGAMVSGCCEPDHPYREDGNMQSRYHRRNSYSMTSGDESEAPPTEVANYQGRTMSEMEYVAGFKRAVIAGNAGLVQFVIEMPFVVLFTSSIPTLGICSGLAMYFAKEYTELNLLNS